MGCGGRKECARCERGDRCRGAEAGWTRVDANSAAALKHQPSAPCNGQLHQVRRQVPDLRVAHHEHIAEDCVQHDTCECSLWHSRYPDYMTWSMRMALHEGFEFFIAE